MNFGSFDNTIYMCVADDVLDYVIENKLSELSTIKIYYPFLFDKNIKSKKMLTKSKDGFSLINWVSYDVCFLLMREINEVDWSNKLSALYLKA